MKQPSRIRRVARDSEHTEQEVRELLATYANMRKSLNTFSKMMAASGGMGGAGGPGMDDDTLFDALMESSGG